MLALDHTEAQLFRMLVTFFGEDRVIPQMSVLAVCGGDLPTGALGDSSVATGFDLKGWAKSNKCLFTVVDAEDTPKLVVEFFSGFSSFVTAHDVEHQRYLKPLLSRAGVQYVTISAEEFDDILDPQSSIDFCTLLHAKVIDADGPEEPHRSS